MGIRPSENRIVTTQNRSVQRRNAKAPRPGEFPELRSREAGLYFGSRDEMSPRNWLRPGRRGRRAGRAVGILGSSQIAGDLILVDVKDHDFIRRLARTSLDVELYGLARGLVFFLD